MCGYYIVTSFERLQNGKVGKRRHLQRRNLANTLSQVMDVDLFTAKSCWDHGPLISWMRIRSQNLYHHCIPLRPWNFCTSLYVLGYVPLSLSLLNRICILLLCDNCINLNYVELVHSTLQVYYIALLTSLNINSTNFWDFDLETPTKILIYLLKK